MFTEKELIRAVVSKNDRIRWVVSLKSFLTIPQLKATEPLYLAACWEELSAKSEPLADIADRLYNLVLEKSGYVESEPSRTTVVGFVTDSLEVKDGRLVLLVSFAKDASLVADTPREKLDAFVKAKIELAITYMEDGAFRSAADNLHEAGKQLTEAARQREAVLSASSASRTAAARS